MADQSLQRFIEEVNGTGHLRVEHDFGDGFVRLQTSEAERRQAAQDIRSSEDIVLEMLRNARDAHAQHVFVALSKEGSKRIITMVDDGDGIPPAMHELVFEPRVTSKLDTSHMDAWGMHGRGMALYSISVNAETAEVKSSNVGLGTSIRVQSDTQVLPEKTDQSSFPTFELVEEGRVNVRGPKNILRTICEFAIDSRATCSVYVGSPAEIAATLYDYGAATLSTIDRLFCNDPASLPLVKRLSTAQSPEQLAALAGEVGLSISSRTARRIIDGDIVDAEAVLDRITIRQTDTHGRSHTSRRAPVDGRSFKLHAQDAALLGETVSKAFEDIAERYYLERDVAVSVRALRDRITITVPIVKKP